MTERFIQLLLDVWREVCQHIEIAEAVARIAPLLVRRLPLDVMLVRQIDPQRGWVETVAAGLGRPGALPERTRSECASHAAERLATWCRRQEVVRGPAEALARSLPGLLPEPPEGEVLAGPLNPTDGPAGLLVLLNRGNRPFRAEHEEMLRALLEPMTIALENDRRLRELTMLREAVEADNRSLLSRLDRHDISDSIVGAGTGLRVVMEQVELVARSDVPVLILGETGSGKEVVARTIHKRSRRAPGPFLRVNCGAIPADLVDSELFGHEKGSFTGAVGERKGWFERADGGTLFLDECGELPLAAQVRLLRILQDGSFQRVGGERQLHVDVRIVAATHRDLQAMAAEGRFREDLWYRLAVFPVQLPPLRERREDIAALAAHFAVRAAKRLGSPPLLPTPDDVAVLMGYPWPGNVRELAAVIERAAILGDGRRLNVTEALGTAPRPALARIASPPSPPVVAETGELLTLDTAMARHIETALARCRGRIEGPDGAACLLNINPHTLRARMRKLGVDWQGFRVVPPSAASPFQRKSA
jgi:transcriptional regulator with GAF, ATPase, and Fis domain